MSLDCSEIQEMFGRIKVQAVLKPFFGPPPAREVVQTSTVHSEAQPSNLKAPSSSPGMFSSCRSNLIMNFDTAEQPSSNGAGLMSFHFLARIGIEIGDNVTAGFGRDLAFAKGFPVPTEISSDVSVTYLLIPFTTRTQETVLSRKSHHDINTVTSLMKVDCYIQDWDDSCFHESTLSLGKFPDFEVVCILGIDVPCHSVLLLYQV